MPFGEIEVEEIVATTYPIYAILLVIAAALFFSLAIKELNNIFKR